MQSEYVIFYSWLLPLSIVKVYPCQHGPVLGFGLTLSNIPLYTQTTSCLHIHPPMDVRVISTFWLLYIHALMHKFLCGHVLSFLLGIYLGVQFTGSYCTCTLKCLRNCQHLFPKWLHPPTSSVGGLPCLHTSNNTWWFLTC